MPARKSKSKMPAKSPAKRFFKGSMSKTRPGRLDFVTHKGDMYFHRGGHLESHPLGGMSSRRPYMRR